MSIEPLPPSVPGLVVERPDVGTLVVAGSERLVWLQGLLTCDVSHLGVGEACWGLSLTKPGKILAEVWVMQAADRCFLGVAGGDRGELLEWLDGFIVMEDVEIDDATDGHAWLALHGPTAAAVAGELAAEHPGFDAAALDWTGLGGAALVGPRGELGKVRVAAEGRGFLAEPAAWERMRIARLVPKYGTDFDGTRNPHEASLDRRAVSWTKGCYLGQEAVCMQDMRGKVKRRLITLAVDAEAPAPGATVEDAGTGEAVGTVTSVVARTDGGGVLAIASVRAGYAAAEANLSVGGQAARVIVTPPAS